LAELNDYRYRGARALVLLHERELRAFVETWRVAATVRVALPGTDDPSYASLETLLFHVLRAARSYMTWMCEKLELPAPGIRATPPAESLLAELEAYLAHLLERWREPLARVPEGPFHSPEHLSRWNVRYCVDAMLEHAVMHPLRHRFQLLELMEAQRG
jgi:uncharacterized damage-inducible protein DinB